VLGCAGCVSVDRGRWAAYGDAPGTGASAEVLPDEAERERAAAEAYSAQRRQQRRNASWQSMVLSLAVVVGIVLVLLMLVPRVNSVTQPPLDVGLGVRAASTQLDFPPSAPTGLPPEWRATSVRTARSTAGVLMWHVGYQTPTQQYAAVQQGQNAPAEWVRAQTNRAPVVGTQSVAGARWTRYARVDKLQNSLVLRHGSVTTVVTGTAGFDELAQLAASLRPAP
jgi:uncharacterized protein DUF4245